MRTAIRTAIAVVPALTLLAACGGSGGSSPQAGGNTGGVQLTMWTRAATQEASQRLVDAYNASHSNHVTLTAIPTDSYQQRIASAAGARTLPDLFASDVIYAPNYTSKGLYADITDRVNALPFKDKLAPSHMQLGTFQDRIYSVPHTLDLSVLFYNKVLYTKAGLDPNKPPTTLKEFAQQARTIRTKLGGTTYGTFFGGDCPGCYVFTMWPSVWAAGGDVMNPDGTASTVDSPQNVEVYQTYRDLFSDGTVLPAARDEKGPTWTGVFPKGNVGVLPMPSTTLGLMPDNDKVQVGVAPIPGPDGGESTFVGGDVIGISSTSSNADAAWDFLSWTVSDEAQVEVVAKNKDIPGRTDLADNKYSASDPRVVTINQLVAKGKTPYSLNFGQTYNDPNGPWLQVIRSAIFGPGDTAANLRTGVGKLTASLSQS